MSSLQNIETRARTLAMLRTAFGPVITMALDDPKVIEIMLNPDGRLWLDKLGHGRLDTGEQLSPAEGERVIRLVASHLGQDVTANTPIISAELPEIMNVLRA